MRQLTDKVGEVIDLAQEKFAHICPGVARAYAHLRNLQRGYPIPVTVDHLAVYGPILEKAWPDLLWGATPGLKVPCADESTQRVRPPPGWVPGCYYDHPTMRGLGHRVGWFWVKPDWSEPGWHVFGAERIQTRNATTAEMMKRMQTRGSKC